MTDMPEIYVYGPNEGAPDHMMWAAAMRPNGMPGSHWLTTGHSEEGVRTALEAMWFKQYPKAKPKDLLKAAIVSVMEADDLV